MRHWLLVLFVAAAGCHRAPVPSNDVLYRSAEASFKKGDLKEALAQTTVGFQRCGSSQEWCWQFRLLRAEILTGTGQTKAALALLDFPENPPRPELQARRRLLQGWAFYRVNDDAQAEKVLGEARSLAEACGSSVLVAEVENRQAVLFEDLGRPSDADATLRHALKSATLAGDRYLEANTLGNLGYLALHQFRYEEAIYWFQKTHELSVEIGAATLEAQATGNLGVCYYELGDFEKARRDLVEAETRLDQAGNRRARQVWLGNSANIFLNAGDFAGALDRWKRALEIAIEVGERARTAEWLTGMAAASIGTGNLDAAADYNNQSLAIDKELKSKKQEPNNRLNSARIAARRQQFGEAKKLFESLLNSDPVLAMEAQAGLADLYVQMGDAAKAEAHFRSTIATIESRQDRLTDADHKLSYLSSLVRFYESYVDFLIRRGDEIRALEVVESSRARILTAGTEARVAVPHGLNAAAFQSLARSSHRIFLSYWLTPKQSYVWVITPAKIEMFTLPPENDIRALVERYRTAIEDLRDPLKSHHPAGEELSRMLLGKIHEFIPAGSRVTIVPDDALHSLNFETLPAVSDPSKYWIEDVTLSVAPSLGLLLNSRPAKKAQPSLLAIADPEPAEGYPRLPNARKEVEAIAGLFSAANQQIYQGKESRPSAYRNAGASSYSLIHFATHGTANRASPLDSALILSREKDSATYTLTARDIMNIPRNADLVTLSACRSAGARAYSGEGLVGLTWAFLQAGARRVIAGLWDVNDESTSMLMSKLYGEVTRGRPAEEALRTAKLSLLHGNYPYRKPYYWGPFQLYTGTEK